MRQTDQKPLTVRELAWTFSAGCLSRFAELPVGHVLERIRVHMNANLPVPSTIPKATQEIVAQGGFKSLYGGLSWNMVSATLKTGTRWVNIKISNSVVEKIVPSDSKVLRAALIGLTAPAITTTIYCPLEFLKVRKMTQVRSPLETRPEMAMQRSLSSNRFSLLQGWRPMYAKEASISVAFNTFYVQFLQWGKQLNNPLPLKSYHLALVGACAGAVCATFTTPFDMIKDQMQIRAGLRERGLFRAAKVIYQQYGISPFVRTMPVKMLRSAWYFGATTLAMDLLNALPAFMQDENRHHSSDEIKKPGIK